MTIARGLAVLAVLGCGTLRADDLKFERVQLDARFRSEGVGVADVMKEAGLTHGGFYAHFESRDALLAAAADQAGAETIEILTRAVKFTANAQTSGGGWGYVSARDGSDFDEGSTTITQVQALRGCRNAGIPVPKEIIDKAIKYIQRCTGSDGGVQYSLKTGGGGRPPITAAAIACLFNAGEYDSEYVPKMMKYCDRYFQNVGNDSDGHWHYAHYYYSQVVYREGEKKWEAYRDKLYSRLVGEATSDGKHSYWTQGYIGPIYTTSVNLTMLQLENGYLPLYQR